MDYSTIPGLPPDQVQGIRLESIFMPEARRQRDKLYRLDAQVGLAQPRLVHYTSAEAALNIIKTKRLWMRNTTCMSDYREVQHGFDILRKFFSDTAKMGQFVAALDLCVAGAAMEAITSFNQWWDTTQTHTYIASISVHQDNEDAHGRLSMWRAFGGSSARVAIVFQVPAFTGGGDALGLLFSPVAYLTEPEVHAMMHEVIQNIGTQHDFLRSVDRTIIVGAVFNMLLAGVTCLKHEGFGEEKEWRAIYSPKRRPSPLMESSTEVIGGVPQLVYKIPLDKRVSSTLAGLDLSRTFDRLIIGPSPYPVAMYQAFVEALAKIDVPNPERRVFFSGIPIRS